MNDKILLTQFEYDYLMVQKEDDVSVNHMDKMIKKGYFSSLKDHFESRDNLKYVSIGTIRDLTDRFEIIDPKETVANLEKKNAELVSQLAETIQNKDFYFNMNAEYGKMVKKSEEDKDMFLKILDRISAKL